MTNDERNSFVIQNSGKKLSAKQFGYNTVFWSIENANAFLDEIVNIVSDNNHLRIVQKIRTNPGIARTQFIAMYLATFHFYSRTVLRVPREAFDEVFVGFLDGIACIEDSSGGKISKEHADYIRAFTGRYIDAISKDLCAAPVDPRAINPPPTEIYKTAIHFLTLNYSEDGESQLEISALESFQFQTYIELLPKVLMLSLKNDLKLTFQA